MDNLETIFGLQLSPNPSAQCLHRAQIGLGEKLLENVEAGIVGDGDNPLCRCLCRPVANVGQRNPKLVLAVRAKESPAVVLLNRLGKLEALKV